MIQISVLIPVYNCEKYLETCLNRVICQTYENFEAICVDDASNDNSAEIIEKFAKKDKRIKLIQNEKNSGYGKSLNRALKEAKGEFISIIEPDDFPDLKMLETLHCEINKDNFDLAKGDFNYFFNGVSKKSNIFKNFDTKNCFSAQHCPEILTMKPSIWSALYRKNFLEENNIFFKETKGASFQDTSFQFKCFYFAKKIKFIEDALYFYRIDNPKSSVNSCEKVFEIFEEFDEINKIFKSQNPKLLAQKLLFEFKVYLWNFRRIKNRYNLEFFNTAAKVFKSYDTSAFFSCREIKIKEKIKLFLFLKHTKIAFILFSLNKMLCKARVL